MLAARLPLGFDRSFEWKIVTIDITPDQRLVLTTDGVVDCTNLQGELFGGKHLAEVAAIATKIRC